MDNASVYGSENCRFESCQDREAFSKTEGYKKQLHSLAPLWPRTMASWTELKMTESNEKYGSLFVFISKKHCRATLKNLLADRRGGWVADGRLCISRVAANFLFSYFREIFNYVFWEIFLKFREIQNYFVKILCLA